MKIFLRITAIMIGLLAVVILSTIILTPWMDQWGATEAEVAAAFPGDGFVSEPAGIVNRAITIRATPEQVFPWLLQLGADRGGFYSYTIIEGLIGCPIVNADRIHPEWQALQAGDEVNMCTGESAPPPYIVAEIIPGQALVLGHAENGQWVETWQFILIPYADGTTRLLLRTRTTLTEGLWALIHPVVFLMERGLLQGVRERAESTDPASLPPSSTPTPEIFNPLQPSPTP